MVSAEMIEILVCPKCKGNLKLGKDKKTLDCYNCMLAYEIKDDIPILLIDKAIKIES